MVIRKLAEPEQIPEHLSRISNDVVECANRVHTQLGPGLMENVYEACLAHELEKRGHKVERQHQMGLIYDQVRIDVGFTIDLLIDSEVIVEIKAIDELLPIHTAQVVTYLKLSNNPLGLLINFNVPLLKDGIKRIVR